MNLTKRAEKGSALTIQEHDANLAAIEKEISEKADEIVTNPTAWHELHKAIKTCLDWVSGTPAPRVSLVMLGDSVGGAAFSYLQPALVQRLGQSGAAFSSVAGPIVTGTVTYPTHEFEHWISGLNVTLQSGATARYGMGGGPYSGTKYTVYLAKYVGAGSATVDLLDGGLSVLETLFSGSLDAAAGVQVVTRTFTTPPGARWVRVTANSGVVKVLGAAFEDRTRPGVFLCNASKGGLQLAEATQTPAAIVNAVIADLAPTVFTWSMKDDRGADSTGESLIQAHLQNFIDTVSSQAQSASWIMVGPSASVHDAGVGIANSRTKDESEAVKAIAIANGYVFVDALKSLGSYEDLISRDAAYDGAHPNQTEYLKLFADFARATGILEAIGYDATGFLRVNAARIASLRIGQSDGAWDVATFLATGSNNDLSARIRRSLQVTNEGGSSIGLHLNCQSATVGQIAKSFTGTLAAAQGLDGLTQSGLWAIHVDQSTNVVSLISRVGATTRTLTLGTLA